MPAIAHITSPNVAHCSGHSMATGSSKWIMEGHGVCRDGDSTTGHLTDEEDPCPGHSTTVSPPNRKWYVDGRLVAAVGDTHCTSISGGARKWTVR